MRTRHVVFVTLAFVSLLPRTFACSCFNDTPIQKSWERYTSPDNAVFTARVVGLIGRIYIQNGKRLSSQALAVVHERYWGLPWYWPKIVLLDGSYPCDTSMFEGEEHLVSGHKGRYGVIEVNGCSRTQPLRTAHVDLRTLDGTHCAPPGGTLIGHVRGEWDSSKHEYRRAKTESIAFRDIGGSIFRASVDNNGIYELRHLQSVLYVPISRLDDHRYVSSREPLSPVREGICKERNFTVRAYQLTGRLLPGIGRSVELVDVMPGSKPVRADSIEPDGRFYFHTLAPGKYVLSVVSTIGDTNRRIFYPGVTDRAKATPIVVNGGEKGRSYDFDSAPAGRGTEITDDGIPF